MTGKARCSNNEDLVLQKQKRLKLIFSFYFRFWLRSVIAGKTYTARRVPSNNNIVPQLDARINTIKTKTTSQAAATTTPKFVLSTTLATSFKVATATTRSISSSNAAASSTHEASCPLKRSRYIPRALEKSQVSAKTDDTWLLYENQWVTAVKVKAGDKVAVTDVSGCAAVFFWNAANIPCTFHLFCGTYLEDGATAAADIADMGGVKPVHVTIAANGVETYDAIAEMIRKEFDDLDPRKHFTPMVYKRETLLSDQRYRYDAVAGIRAVIESKITQASCSRQNAGKL